MPSNQRYLSGHVKPFRRDMFSLAVSIRDDAPALVRRVFARKARVYQPYVKPHALSKAKNGSGGPFGQLPAWLAALELDELTQAREWVDAVFDRFEAERAQTPLCLRTAMLAQQEADTAEDLEESRAHMTGDYRPWMKAAQLARARMRVAEIAAARVGR